MAQIERLILAELNRNGPLPPRWYLQYNAEQHCIRYRTRDDEHIYRYHPLSAEFVEAYPQTLLRPDPKRETCEGALHPPHSYQAGEWTWHEKSEGYAAAILDAFNCINKQDYVLAGEIAARVTSIKNDSTIDERPKEFYHPQDRPTVYRNSQALDSEVDAAMLARSLGYDWARKAAQFRQHELQITQEDLTKIAVTVQRHIRAGYPGGRPSLDDLIVYYHQQSEQGRSELQILEGWQQRTARLQTDILTVEWVTHAIACGNDEAAKEVADAFDVAYAAKARLMAGRRCNGYEDACASLASQLKDRHRQEIASSVEEAPTPEPQASFAPLNASRETLVFGCLTADSALRWRPSLVSSMPTFRTNIRQNHFIGSQLDQSLQARKKAKARGYPVPYFTPHGRLADMYSENHLEEEFEFDLSDMEIFSIHEVTRSAEHLEQLLGDVSLTIPADATLGLVQWRMKEGLRASRTRLQVSNFSPDSAQVTCREILMQRQSHVFTAVISLRKEHLRKAFQRYMALVNVDRYLTPDGKPRNDWYLSRFPEYSPNAPNRFHEYQRRPTLSLPVPPWLVHLGQDGKPTYAPVYRTDGFIVARKTFANISAYETHFMSALLYDRDERNALQTQQYSYHFEYASRVQELPDGQFSFDIQIKGDSVALGGQKLIPHIGNEITVFIVGLSDRLNEETQVKGRVFDAVMDGYDFKVVVTGAGGLGKDAMHRLCMQGSAKVHVIWRDQDLDNARKIAAVMEACDLIKTRQNPVPLSHIGGKARGKFSLRNILLDQEVDTWAPDLASHLIADYHNETVTWDEATEIAASMIDVCSLNEEQQKFFNAALAGPYANTLILERVPGSGKTTSLAALVIAVMRMGAKVLVCSPSNSGASALFDQVIKLFDSRKDILDLGNHCVRYRSNMAEELAMESALPPDPLRQGRRNYSMASRIYWYTQHNPEDPVVRDFQSHIQARRLGKRPASKNSFKTVITLLQKRVMDDCLLVGATAFMSTNLHELNYNAHILIFDEASQATEPDLLMAAATQPDLLLVVLAGDLKQLGPVVPSHSNSRNPYGSILATSPLRRLQTAYPQIQSMMLHRNCRAHPSLIEMPSGLFYDGSMVAGCADQDYWDTNLARNVRAMLTGPDFAGAFWDRELALSRDNRQFFLDVAGSPVREENGTSWRNEGGVAAVVAIAKRLTTTCNVAPSDIGIVSMYREDVRYLKEQLKAAGLAKTNVSEIQQLLKTSTVVAFQGEQRRVMIVHFVAGFDGVDPQHSPFRFIKDHNRLNVAITRAREYQFLVGDLSFWLHWKKNTHHANPYGTAVRKILQMTDYVVEHGQVIEWKKVR
ncbi:hypothetical protein KC349_g8298 [Hortaea werneckii]|nr:hypothetical protein KC349_g8298 [Hortaea werneckii]